MTFNTPLNAIQWLDNNPDCKKTIYARDDCTIYIGDIDNLDDDPEIWVELSRRELINMED